MIEDAQGKEISIGSYVVYNLSGDLALGRIVGIKYKPVGVLDKIGVFDRLEIECLTGYYAGQKARTGQPHISKVRNTQSCFVIDPDIFKYMAPQDVVKWRLGNRGE